MQKPQLSTNSYVFQGFLPCCCLPAVNHFTNMYIWSLDTRHSRQFLSLISCRNYIFVHYCLEYSLKFVIKNMWSLKQWFAPYNNSMHINVKWVGLMVWRLLQIVDSSSSRSLIVFQSVLMENSRIFDRLSVHSLENTPESLLGLEWMLGLEWILLWISWCLLTLLQWFMEP